MKRKTLLILAIAAATFCCLAACEGETSGLNQKKVALRVLYVGHPGTSRERDFVEFLERHFAKVGKGDLAKFEPKDAKAFDVVIMDYSGLTIKGNTIITPRMPFGRGYSRPVLTIGAAGALMSDSVGLKTGYL